MSHLRLLITSLTNVSSLSAVDYTIGQSTKLSRENGNSISIQGCPHFHKLPDVVLCPQSVCSERELKNLLWFLFQLHQNEFNLDAALNELYSYAVRYNDEVTYHQTSHTSSFLFFSRFLSHFYVGSMFLMRHLHLARSCWQLSEFSYPTSRPWCHPTTSASVFLSFFSPAPPSPSLSCPQIPLLFSVHAHTTSTYFPAFSWIFLPPSLSL